MKVVIINDASTARGGATGLALEQARRLAARGLDVTFFAADRTPNGELRDLGLRLVNVGADPLMKAPPHVAATRGLWNPEVRRQMAALIARSDTPDTLYHVHSWSKALSPSLFAALAPVAPRTFLHGHDFFLACPNGGFMDYREMEPCARVPLSAACLATRCDKRSMPQKLWRVARSLLLGRALPKPRPLGGLMMIHPAMRPYFERSGWPPQVLQTLRNPASPLTAGRVPAEANRSLLFIGRIEAEKGVEDLIAAAAGLPLTIVGDGPLRARLAARHPEVRFTGWLGRAGLAAEAARARALVMPSRYPEPFGLVAAEAALSGLPVLVSAPALLAEEIAAKGIGWSCNTRSPEHFAAMLRHVVGMPAAEIAAMSRRAAAGAGLSSAPETWTDGLLAAYGAALAA